MKSIFFRILIILNLVGCTSQVLAQDQDQVSPLYIQVMEQWAKTTNFAENAAKVLVAKIKMDLDKDPKNKQLMTKAFSTDLEQFFYELFISHDTIKQLAQIYSQYFTIDEMQELIKFYKTPLGEKLIKSESEISIKTQQLGYALLKKHQKDYMKVVGKYVVKDKKRLEEKPVKK